MASTNQPKAGLSFSLGMRLLRMLPAMMPTMAMAENTKRKFQSMTSCPFRSPVKPIERFGGDDDERGAHRLFHGKLGQEHQRRNDEEATARAHQAGDGAHHGAFGQDQGVVELHPHRRCAASVVAFCLRIMLYAAATMIRAKKMSMPMALLTGVPPSAEERVGKRGHQPGPRGVHRQDARDAEHQGRAPVDVAQAHVAERCRSGW